MKYKNNQIIISIMLVLSIIVVGISTSYAYFKASIIGNSTQTHIKSDTFDIKSTLDKTSSLSFSNMKLIDESEIGTLAQVLTFDIKSLANNSNKGYFDIYIKDMTISNNLISEYFKYQILLDNKLITTGNFKAITAGVGTQTSVSKYVLKNNIAFNDGNNHTVKVRFYLLNDNNVNQINLMNSTVNFKVGINAYK